MHGEEGFAVMSDDMSEIIQKMSEMLKNDQIPDNIKSIMNGVASQSNSNSDSSESNNSDIPNIDLATMMKMKSVIDSMNKQQNDPRANLLRSLKPYLKQSRKEKVDQYIKLFSMGKAFEVLNPLGGEKKNDI